MLPVHPVGRIERLTTQGRKQERPKSKQEKASFSSMLEAMMQAEDPENSSSFDALA